MLMLDTIARKPRTDKTAGKPKVILVSSRLDAERIAFVLNRDGGFQVAGICQEDNALDAISHLEPALVLLAPPEWNPGSAQTCQRIRKASEVALVICSRGANESDVVSGLDAGADDYLALPMNPAEFAARLRAVTRRTKDLEFSPIADDHLIAGELEVDLEERRASFRGREIELSPTEFRLLTSLARQAGRPVSHSKLLAQTWGPEYTDARNYIRLYIKRLRSKLEDDPDAPKLILNERGIGYRLQPSAAA
jgi:DNA-binding response OmpR family regulator